MSLEFGGFKETYQCTRIQFIQLRIDEDFQEAAETRSNLGVLLKRAAVLTGLLAEMGAGDSVGLFVEMVLCPTSITLLIHTALPLVRIFHHGGLCKT